MYREENPYRKEEKLQGTNRVFQLVLIDRVTQSIEAGCRGRWLRWVVGLLGVFLMGCVHVTELDSGPLPDNASTLTLGVGDLYRQPRSPEGWEFEDQIKRVRLVIFGAMGERDHDRLILNQFYPVLSADKTIRAIVTNGYRDIHIIVNEPLGAGATELPAYRNISTPQELAALQLSYGGETLTTADHAPYRPVEIPMIRTLRNKLVSGTEPNVITGEEGAVLRTMAKVSLALECDYTNPALDKGGVVVDRVRVVGLPRWRYWVRQAYDNSASNRLFGSETQAVVNALAPPASNNGFQSLNVFYIPEFILTPSDTPAYLEVSAHMALNATQTFTYEIPLGDGINPAESGSEHYNITRNHHYIFTGTIIGYGSYGGLKIDPQVKGWTDVPIPNDVLGRTLNVSGLQASIIDVEKARFYFSSNQSSVQIEEIGYTGATGSEAFTVNDFFDRLAGGVTPEGNFHYDYNPVTKTGTGYVDVSTVSTTAGSYIHRLLLNAGGLQREITIHTTIRLRQSIVNSGTYQFAYVGTFHRHNEVGERLIRIPNITSGTITTGAWTASVIEGADWIRLDKDVPATHPENNEAESAPAVTGTAPVTGICSASEPIAFRVGLTNTIEPTENRYGVIMLLYNDNTKIHKIYVRQGEAPAVIKSGTTARWSPYNITQNGGYYRNVPSRGASLTEYPTQAGAFFQWNSLHAFPPYADWNARKYTHTGAWASGKDPCPSSTYSGDGCSYRTPTGDNTGVDEFSSLSTSPSVWGYYADGFFDRRQITWEYSVGSMYNSAVAAGSSQIAYIGMVFYDPTTNASLFAPYPGTCHPNPTNGQKHHMGASGYWWSSSPAWYLALGTNSTGYGNAGTANRHQLHCVRCVEE